MKPILTPWDPSADPTAPLRWRKPRRVRVEGTPNAS